MKRKVSVLAIVFILTFSALLAGCSTKDKTAEPTSSLSATAAVVASATPSESVAPAPSTVSDLPFGDGTQSLTIGSPDNKYKANSYKDNLPVWAEVEKRTGVKINWDVQPSKQYSTSMPIRMASGSGLPDIFSVVGDILEAGDNGLIIPLNDLIDQHAPHIKKLLDANPDALKRMKSPDGKIYNLPSLLADSNKYDPIGLIINKTWLDKLNLQMPTTLDEWYTVLKAFKEQDPNGNGLKDEIPISPDGTVNGMNLFGNAFNLHLEGSAGFYPDKNGKVVFEYILPEAKAWITWINKLYKEGLIDPEFITKTGSVTFAGQGILGAVNGQLNHVSILETAVAASGKVEKFVETLPPAPLDGGKPYYELANPISGNFAISKDAKDPVLAIKWLDFVYASDEGIRLMNMGVEGKSYTIVDGKAKFTDFVLKNPDGLDVTNALRSLGARPALPYTLTGEGLLETLNYPGLLDQQKVIAPYLIPGFMFAGASTAENDIIFKYQPDINTYVNSEIAKFMTGAESLDNWDKYVAHVKEMDVDKLLEPYQAEYDRYMSK